MATDNSKRKIGSMPCEGSRCPSHDRKIPVVVFENKHGTLSYSCDWCGRAPYAKTGTGQHEEWREELTLFDVPPAPPRSTQPASVAPVAASTEDATAATLAPATAQAKKKAGLSWTL